MATAIDERLLTADEYFARPNDDQHKELVRGRIVAMNMPGFEHGLICATVGFLLRQFVSEHGLGRVVGNDSGILTERDPDTVRGADVAYYSYQRLPRERRPTRYAEIGPELVFEVLSPDDRWTKMLRKVSEYLEAGVLVVCVVDPSSSKVFVYRPDTAAIELAEQDDLTLPGMLDGFRVNVRQFFE